MHSNCGLINLRVLFVAFYVEILNIIRMVFHISKDTEWSANYNQNQHDYLSWYSKK